MCAETKKKPSKTAKPSSPTAGPAKTHDTTGAKSDARQSSPRCVTADVTAQAQAAQAARAAPRGAGLCRAGQLGCAHTSKPTERVGQREGEEATGEVREEGETEGGGKHIALRVEVGAALEQQLDDV